MKKICFGLAALCALLVCAVSCPQSYSDKFDIYEATMSLSDFGTNFSDFEFGTKVYSAKTNASKWNDWNEKITGKQKVETSEFSLDVVFQCLHLTAKEADDEAQALKNANKSRLLAIKCNDAVHLFLR